MSNVKAIEVYEWKEGAPRPGTVTKASRDCIDFLAVPEGGQVPNVGDMILLPKDGKISLDFDRYRVIEREFLFYRTPDESSQTPMTFSKMWIHVRRVDD